MNKIIIKKCIKGYDVQFWELKFNGSINTGQKLKDFDIRCKQRECEHFKDCQYNNYFY